MTVLSTTLTKLSLRYSEIETNKSQSNSFQTQAMLIMTSIIRAGKSRHVSSQIDEDSYSRIITCIRVLSSVPHEKAMVETFLNDTKIAFGKLIQAREVVILLFS
jgi:coatomer subunit beta